MLEFLLLAFVVLSCSQSAPLPLRNITHNAKLSSCANASDIAAIIGVLLPSGYNAGFIPIYSATNFTIIQIVFLSN